MAPYSTERNSENIIPALCSIGSAQIPTSPSAHPKRSHQALVCARYSPWYRGMTLGTPVEPPDSCSAATSQWFHSSCGDSDECCTISDSMLHPGEPWLPPLTSRCVMWCASAISAAKPTWSKLGETSACTKNALGRVAAASAEISTERYCGMVHTGSTPALKQPKSASAVSMPVPI